MPQINKPTDYFNTKLYTGNGSTQSVTGVGFQPDFTWIKDRSDVANHFLFDSIRGATKAINSNQNYAESTQANALTAFNSDGFTVGSDGDVNGSGDLIASWNFLAGGTASSNTDGSITSSVSANTTSGFSIVSYTGNGVSGATIGHGLGVAPAMIIQKNRDSVENWRVYHNALADNTYMNLSTTGAVVTGNTTVWGGANPTSSVFTVGNDASVNNSGDNIIAYCFAEKKGFSKFGSYVGNGGNQFIYTGFKPAFVIEKRSSTTSEWDMYDNKRNTFNSVTKVLKPNASDAETTYGGLNFLSNGFEAKGSLNDSGATLIYMAFAESPLVGTNNIPATAR